MASAASPAPATAPLLDEQLDRLAAFEPTHLPVISLYLNTQADEHGKDQFETFLRKEFNRQAESFSKRSPERESFDRDVERIREWLTTQLQPSANGAAIFACSGKDNFFEAIQLSAPIDEHQLYVYNQPYLYTLARLYDQFPRYIAVVADTNQARVYVVGMRAVETSFEMHNPKMQRTKVGGWSQARYQRHVENFQSQHVKELMETLDYIVREEKIDKILIGGDQVFVSFLRDQLTPTLSDKIVDVLKLDIRTPEKQVLEDTLAALSDLNTETDADKVSRFLDAWRARGLAAAGVEDVMRAFVNGQVEELLLTANLEQTHTEPEPLRADLAPQAADTAQITGGGTVPVLLPDELVTRARQTGAKVTFIEDPTLLANVGGVGAMLRFKLKREVKG